MWRWIIPALIAFPVQADTLADVRRDVDSLLSDLSAMELEVILSDDTTPALTGTLLERIAAVEEELRRLVQTTEQLDFRIHQLGGRAQGEIQDIQFRLCALEADCDDPTGGRPIVSLDSADPIPVVAPIVPVAGQAEYDAANALFVTGDSEAALQSIAQFQSTYPDSPLLQQSHFLAGAAQADQGHIELAARAFLSAYVQDPTTPVAADALYQLALTFHGMEQHDESCLALAEVEAQFPDSTVVADANAAFVEFGCA